jgi:hypothetical protein
MNNPATTPASVPAATAAASLFGRYATQLTGQLRCFDRVLLHGTLVDVAHPGALLVHMHAAGFKPRDVPRFAQPLNAQVRDNAIGLARQHGVEIEVVTRKNFRQEDRIAALLKTRGLRPGLVHIFAVKEAAQVYDTRHARPDGYAQVFVRRGCCLHYYFYFLHERLGLIHVRVPTWLPFRVQVYLNGHSWLACQLAAAGVSYTLLDNAFSACADWPRAQALADAFDPRSLHAELDVLARQCCPVVAQFPNGYHWCLTQVEYAQDLVFKDPAVVEKLFEELARQALLVIKLDDVARFLGKRLPMGHDTAVNSHLGRRHAGLRLKHTLGPASVKLYNKPGGILRLEVTTYDVSFFRHYRTVEHRDGSKENALAAMKKTLYSLHDLAAVMRAGVERYSQWLASLVEHSASRTEVERLGAAARDEQGRSYRGFNLFLQADLQALETVLRGEYALGGLTHRRLRQVLPQWTRSQLGRLLRRLRLHGLLRKVGGTFTYYLTDLARQLLPTVLHLRQLVVLPALASAAAPA